MTCYNFCSVRANITSRRA